jgi:hypothetical protein
MSDLDWGVELQFVVKHPSAVTGETAPDSHTVAMVDRVDGIENSYPVTRIHSIGEYNQGFVFKPPEFRGNIRVNDLSDSVKIMRFLEASREKFDIEITQKSPSENVWRPYMTLYKGCVIVNSGTQVMVAENTFTQWRFEAQYYAFSYSGSSNMPTVGSGDILTDTQISTMKSDSGWTEGE